MRIQANGEIDLPQVKRVLVIRLDEIGDVVLTTPLLRELRRNLPGAWITLVVKPEVHNLVELCPYVNEVVAFNWQRQWNFQRLLFWVRFWSRRFNLVILPRWGVESPYAARLAYLSGARWRVGFQQSVLPNSDSHRSFTHLLNAPYQIHMVQHGLDLLCWLGGAIESDKLELWLSNNDKDFAEAILKKERALNINNLIAIGVGGRHWCKKWPTERYADLARWMQQTYHARIIVVGGREDVLASEYIKTVCGSDIISVAGRATLRETAALLEYCRLYIGNDTGPKHIAAAMRVPIVEISWHAEKSRNIDSPIYFRPWGVPHTLVQPKLPILPCTEGCYTDKPHCILQITVESVKEAVQGIMRLNESHQRHNVNLNLSDDRVIEHAQVHKE